MLPRPNAIYSRLSVSPLAISLPSVGCIVWAGQRYNSARMPKPSVGSNEVSKPTAISFLAHFMLGAALALVGAVDEARTAANAGLALNPGFTIRRFGDGASSDNPMYLAGRERVRGGMRLAGVPEA